MLSLSTQGIEGFQTVIDLLFCIISYRARVEEHGICLVQFFGGLIASHLHHLGHHLGVSHIHLATIGHHEEGERGKISGHALIGEIEGIVSRIGMGPHAALETGFHGEADCRAVFPVDDDVGERGNADDFDADG